VQQTQISTSVSYRQYVAYDSQTGIKRRQRLNRLISLYYHLNVNILNIFITLTA